MDPQQQYNIDLSQTTPVHCEKCGCEKNPLGNHYVGGHLQCACGKNIDECCQGEVANELND